MSHCEHTRGELESAIGAAEGLTNPPDPELLEAYAGVYGHRKITYQDRALYYQR